MLELDEDRHVLRTGEIVGGQGAQSEVRWSDGTAQPMRDSRRKGFRYATPFAGGLEHRLLVDAEETRSLFRTQPAEAFVLALRDSADPQLSKDLIDRWEREFARPEVSTAWRKVKDAFEALPQVKITGSDRARRYSWIGDDEAATTSIDEPRSAETTSSEALVEPVELVGSVELVEVEPSEPESAPTVVPDAPADVVAKPTASQVPPPERNLARDFKSLAREKTTDLPLTEIASQVRRAPAAVQAVYGVLTASEWRTSLVRALTTPLRSAISLAEFSDDTLAVALERSEGAVGSLLLAIPRSSKVVGDVRPDAAGVDAVIGRAIEEHRVHRSATDSKALASSLGFLLDRVLAEPIAARLSLSTILASAAALDRLRPQSDDHDAVVAALRASIVTLGPSGWQRLSAADKASVARRSARASLAPEGARLALLTTIWRFEPDQVRDTAWWEGATFDELAGVAGASTRPILTEPAIRETIVEPRTRRALDEATTRRRVMTVLAAPSEIAQTLNADEVRGAITRVSATDDLTRDWVTELSDAAGRFALEQRLEQADQELQSLRAAADEAHAAAAAATDRLRRAEERLLHASHSADGLRDSQARQIRVDAVRAVADMAAYVESALERQSPQRISARVAAIAKREGLTRLGEPGEEVPYKPSEHDLVGSPVEPGTAVVVRHVGYTWDGPDGEIVLARALVERAT